MSALASRGNATSSNLWGFFIVYTIYLKVFFTLSNPISGILPSEGWKIQFRQQWVITCSIVQGYHCNFIFTNWIWGACNIPLSSKLRTKGPFEGIDYCKFIKISMICSSFYEVLVVFFINAWYWLCPSTCIVSIQLLNASNFLLLPWLLSCCSNECMWLSMTLNLVPSTMILLTNLNRLLLIDPMVAYLGCQCWIPWDPHYSDTKL